MIKFGIYFFFFPKIGKLVVQFVPEEDPKALPVNLQAFSRMGRDKGRQTQ